MADLKTTYMGIELRNPLVIKSLFEEQIQLERAEFEAELAQYDDLYGEAMSLFPRMEHAGPKQHLYWVAEAKKAVSMPLFGSLNAFSQEVWIDYAKQLAETGVDGLELNFYSLPRDAAKDATSIEQQELETFKKVREVVKIPLAVKLHPFYTNVLQVADSFAKAGADAVVVFNRLFQPDIDIEGEQEASKLVLSSSGDALLPLRWVALLHGRVDTDIVANTGIMSGKDAVKMILAGASAVQVVSSLYKNKIPYVGEMLSELESWMDDKGYASLADFRGKVSKQKTADPWGFERGQYIKALLGFD